MRLRDIGASLRDEKKILRNGMILLGFAAVLVLLLMKIDQVWAAISTVVGTVAPKNSISEISLCRLCSNSEISAQYNIP